MDYEQCKTAYRNAFEQFMPAILIIERVNHDGYSTTEMRSAAPTAFEPSKSGLRPKASEILPCTQHTMHQQ